MGYCGDGHHAAVSSIALLREVYISFPHPFASVSIIQVIILLIRCMMYSSILHVGWGLCDRLCLVLVCRGKYSFGGMVLLFILESILGGGGLVRGLRGGGRRAWREEWARSG